MGIRVHKVIGYGLVDLEHNESTMIDKRIDWNIFEELYDKSFGVETEEFIKWYEDNFEYFTKIEAKKFYLNFGHLMYDKELHISHMRVLLQEEDDWDLSKCIVHDNEYGCPNVMVFIAPLVTKQWKRWDDTIDWIEETQNYNQQNRFQLLDRELYPYTTKMVCFRNARKNIWKDVYVDQPKIEGFVWEGQKLVAMNRGEYNRLIGKWDSNVPAKADKKLMQHLIADWKPTLPKNIIAVLYWFRTCFTNFEKIIDSLRPILYVYWS